MGVFTAVEIRRLSVGSVYKLILIGLTCSLIPLSVVFGVFSLFGAGTIKWNDKPLTGVTGLVASPFIGVFVSLVFTAIAGSLTAIGLWIYSKIRIIRLIVQQ